MNVDPDPYLKLANDQSLKNLKQGAENTDEK
jgi:hypothetical protein